MTYLLDTHILIWYIENDLKLSSSVRLLLDEITNSVLVSHASFWEMAIKKSIGRLEITLPQPALECELANHLIQLVSFETAHYEVLEALPFHHQDPFGRMLIAQAIAGGFTLITQDRKFRGYEELVSLFWND